MPGYRVRLDGEKAAKGVCPECKEPFFEGNSNKTRHGPKDGDGSCHKNYLNKKKRLQYQHKKLLKQATAPSATRGE
jgi:hypothetical protein